MPGDGGYEPPRPGRRWAAVLGAVSTLLVVAGIGVAFIRLPYDTIAPGLVREVNDLVAVEGHPVYPPKGEVLFATVSARTGINPYEALVGWLAPSVDVVPQEVVRGDLREDEFQRLNVEAMADSKTLAEILALRYVGFTDLGVGAELVEVDPTLPAGAVLKARDVVVAIDGKPVKTSDDAVAAIVARKAGDDVTIRFIRDGGKAREATATLARGDHGRPLLGVRLTTKIELPFKIVIDSGEVVGPSAGLAYALELLDLLTPGELTGGARVAATGDLGRDGAVRPVGGSALKAIAVERAAADLFLVPKENEAEARSRVGEGVRVIGVATFDEALQALGSLAGSNALELVTARPAA